MLRVTREAKIELHDMLMDALADRSRADEERPDEAELGFRLIAGGVNERDATRIGLALDAPREGDEIVTHRSHSLLILDPLTSALLSGLTLDVVETAKGTLLGLCE